MLARTWLRDVGPALPLSLILFWLASGWLTSSFPLWHEEVSVYPNQGYLILQNPGSEGQLEAPVLEESCATGDTRLITSDQRPSWSLCVGGDAYPIMIMSYAAGYVYWPSRLLAWWHHDDAVRLRVLSIFLGSGVLLLTWMLLRWLGDRRVADAAVILVGVSSPFILLHSLLVQYETLPWLMVLAAMLALTRCPPLAPGADPGPGAPATLWLVLAAAALGLAVAANIKAVLLIVPLGLVSALFGVRWGTIRFRQRLVMAAAAAVPLLPTAAFGLLDPGGRFSDQVIRRLSRIFETPLAKVASEPLNLAAFGTDIMSYFDGMAGISPPTNWPAVALGLAAFVYCLVALLRGRRSRAPAAAAAGALLLVFFLASIFLYAQYPPANYSPISAVFGVALACTLVAAGRAVEGRLQAKRPWPTALFVGLAAILLFANTVRRGDPVDWLEVSFNPRAERAAAEYLLDHERESLPILSTTYALAGVLESMGHGQLRPYQVQGYLLTCRTPDEGAQRACVRSRWRSILSSGLFPPPLRVLGPATALPVDEPEARWLWTTLEEAAASLGLRVSKEWGYALRRDEVIVIYRVERDRPAAPDMPE